MGVPRRRRGLMALSVAALMAVAGCSTSQTPTMAGTGAAAGPGSASNEPPTTLTMWTYQQGWVPGLRAAADAYNTSGTRKLALDVQYIDQANGVYASKVTAGARSNTLPDLLNAYGPMWDYVGGGLFKELTTSFGGDATKDIPASIIEDYVKYSKTTADACQANKDCTYKNVQVGQIYAMPLISGSTGYVFARKDNLKAAGLDPDKAPTTWDEWVSMVKQSQQKLGDKGTLAMPLQIPETAWFWMFRPQLFQYLGPDGYQKLMDDKTGAAWASPEVTAAIGKFDQLRGLWHPTSSGNSIPATDTLFASGGATWYFGGTYSMAGLVQQGIKPQDLLIFPAPSLPGSKLTATKLKPWASGWVGISKDTKHQEQAEAFLKFLMTPAGASAFADAANDTPAVTLTPKPGSASAALVGAVSAAQGTGLDAFDEVKSYGPVCDGAKTVNNEAAVALTQLIMGKSDGTMLSGVLKSTYNKGWSACG